MAIKGKSRRGPKCSICSHPERHALEMGHVAGCSLDALSAKYSTPKHPAHRASIHRHFRDGHLTESDRASLLADVPIQELAARACKENMSLLDYFSLIRSQLISQMLVATGCNDGHRTAVLAGRAVEVLKEIGKITGEITRLGSSISITNNVAMFSNSPQFAELTTGLIAIARAHPDARQAIVELLRGIDATHANVRPNGAHLPLIEGEAAHVVG